MKNFAGVKSSLIAAVIGALIGGTITGVVAYRIFKKQLLINQNSIFVEDIEAASKSYRIWKSTESEDARKSELKEEAELYLNRAWSRALVTLPDKVFSEIHKTFKRGKIDTATRNRLYHLLREQLYPETNVKYDDIMTTRVSIKE